MNPVQAFTTLAFSKPFATLAYIQPFITVEPIKPPELSVCLPTDGMEVDAAAMEAGQFEDADVEH